MSTDIDWTDTWETNYGKVVLQQTKNIVTGVFVIHIDQSGRSFQGMWWKLGSLDGKEWHGRKV